MFKSKKKKKFEVFGYLAGGATAGAGFSAWIGGMGLAFGGTAISIGMAPVAVAGAITGLAAYGVKKAIKG